MNRFRQHIPTFVETRGEPIPVYEFSTTDELLALEVVRKGHGKGPRFSHFAMENQYLMEISDDGFDWWVVGTVSDPTAVELPQWEGWKFRARLVS